MDTVTIPKKEYMRLKKLESDFTESERDVAARLDKGITAAMHGKTVRVR